jgi:hypothetical protein
MRLRLRMKEQVAAMLQRRAARRAAAEKERLQLSAISP